MDRQMENFQRKMENATLPTFMRLDASVGLLLLAMDRVVSAMGVTARLWDDGGAGVTHAQVSDPASAPGGSEFTAGWWAQAFALVALFRVWLALPMSAMVQLEFTDGNGDVQTPFSIVPISGMTSEQQNATPAQVLSRAPETPPTAE